MLARRASFGPRPRNVLSSLAPVPLSVRGEIRIVEKVGRSYSFGIASAARWVDLIE
jgi:hypothetical protein